MIPALRSAQTPAGRSLEIIRVVMLLLTLAGWVMYPLELVLLGHWLESWQSKIPYLLAIPGFIFTLWILFDRKTNWLRLSFIVTMWLAVLIGALGSFYHVLWNFEGDIDWTFYVAMESVAGSRPTLAALAFTHMGVTGLLSIYRAR
jgi:hypothetical protein